MWWVAGALVMIVAWTGTAGAEDIYRWRDSQGRLHFENVPAPGDRRAPAPEPAAVAADAAAAPEAAEDDGAAPRRAVSDEAYSADVSNRRTGLERELREAQRRLRDIDVRLEALAAARLRNARGSAATGGVGAPAENVLSPEEEALVEEREQLAQHAEEVRNDAAELRQEVEARLGAVPAWWSDLR
jgi:hypothetical protein